MSNKFVTLIKNNKNRIDIIKSSFSILLGILLIALLIFLSVKLADATRKFVQVADNSIDNLRETLVIASDSIDNVAKSFDTLDSALITVQGYISEINPILSNVKNIISTDLLKLANEGRDSLLAAADGSKIVDDTLSLLSRIPLLNFSYEPKKTLNQSLTELSDTFATLPDSLTNLEEGLTTTNTSLEAFDNNFASFNANISNMKNNLLDVSESIEGFDQKLLNIQTDLPKTQRNIILWISIITVLLCLIVVAWIFSQIYTFIIARESLKSDRIV